MERPVLDSLREQAWVEVYFCRTCVHELLEGSAARSLEKLVPTVAGHAAGFSSSTRHMCMWTASQLP